MKTIVSAVLFASFVLCGPVSALAGEAEAPKKTATKEPDKKDPKAADTKGPVKKDDKSTNNSNAFRGNGR
jgi:hypothetical protein